MDVTDFEALVTMGVYDYVGPDDNGEPQYVLNIKQALELCPEIYWAHKNAADLEILNAFANGGFVDWDINPNTLEETLSFNV